MNICLIGYGIPSLVLANILANRNIKISIFDDSKLKNKSNTRTLGIAKKNIEFLKEEIYRLEQAKIGKKRMGKSGASKKIVDSIRFTLLC